MSDSALNFHVEAMVKLHRLMANGKGDTEEAEGIRYLSADVWHELDDLQREKIQGVSSDLFLITEEELGYPHPEFSGFSDEEIKDRVFEFIQIFREEDRPDPIGLWVFMRLLRTRPNIFSRALRADARAVAYKNLGFICVGLEFEKYSKTLQPVEK